MQFILCTLKILIKKPKQKTMESWVAIMKWSCYSKKKNNLDWEKESLNLYAFFLNYITIMSLLQVK